MTAFAYFAPRVYQPAGSGSRQHLESARTDGLQRQFSRASKPKGGDPGLQRAWVFCAGRDVHTALWGRNSVTGCANSCKRLRVAARAHYSKRCLFPGTGIDLQPLQCGVLP